MASQPGAAKDATIPDRAAKDSAHAWGDDAEGGNANDERLLRDRPPHW